MIETEAELLEWIAGNPERHQQTGPCACSCGWSDDGLFAGTDNATTWENHFNGVLIYDLGDVLPSDTGSMDGPIPWRVEYDTLYQIIDTYADNCTCNFVWPDDEKDAR